MYSVRKQPTIIFNLQKTQCAFYSWGQMRHVLFFLFGL